MRILVLGSVQSWYARDLQRAARGRWELCCAPFSHLEALVDCSGWKVRSGSAELLEAQAIVVRAMPPGSLEQVVFRLNLLHELQARGTIVVNPPRALELAIDKGACTWVLQRQGVPVPRTWLGQRAEDAMQAVEELGLPVVLKPLFGSQGRGLTLLEDPGVAYRVFRLLEQHQVVFYLQEYVDHPGWDARVLVIGEKCLCVRRFAQKGWCANVAQGGRMEPWPHPPAEVLHLAQRAAQAIGAWVAGVDLACSAQGQWFVLEVNAVPGWQALAQTLQVDVALEVLQLCHRRWEQHHKS